MGISNKGILVKYEGSPVRARLVPKSSTLDPRMHTQECDVYLDNAQWSRIVKLIEDGYTVIGGLDYTHNIIDTLSCEPLPNVPYGRLVAGRTSRRAEWDAGTVGVIFKTRAEKLRFHTDPLVREEVSNGIRYGWEDLLEWAASCK